MKSFFFLFCLLFLNFFNKIQAQKKIKDTIFLDEIIINEKIVSDKIGFKLTKISPIILKEKMATNLSEILAENSPIFIKSYGNGRLSSSSFRGAGASHTQVLWNGISINSAMLGQSDFSQIPTYFIDKLNLYHGGASLENNQGALGGSILIENKADWNKKIFCNFSQEIASFGTYKSFLTFIFTKNKLQSKTRIINEKSANNFTYKNENAEEKIQKNAHFSQKGILQEFYYRANSNNMIDFKFWGQKNKNQIPPSEKEKQNQDILRALISWKNYQEKYNFAFKTAYTYDNMNYINENNDNNFINSKNKIHVFHQNINYNYNYSKVLKYKIGTNFTHTKVNSNNYENQKIRNNISINLGVNYFIFNDLQTSFFLKQEKIDQDFSPLIPSISFDYAIFEHHFFNTKIHLKTNFFKTYHYPSLNDLYWYPNGNTNLKPENATSFELGFILENDFSDKINSVLELTSFYSKVNNWILWLPVSSEIWTPINAKKVERKGLEMMFKLKTKKEKFNLFFNNTLTYTLATNLQKINELDNSLGKQLIYVPKFTYNNYIRFSYQENFISINNQFSDLVYTNSDNLDFLPAYFLTNLSFGKNFKWKNYFLNFQLKIKNLLNNNYQVVLNYQMPPRNYHFILSFNF